MSVGEIAKLTRIEVFQNAMRDKGYILRQTYQLPKATYCWDIYFQGFKVRFYDYKYQDVTFIEDIVERSRGLSSLSKKEVLIDIYDVLEKNAIPTIGEQ